MTDPHADLELIDLEPVAASADQDGGRQRRDSSGVMIAEGGLTGIRRHPVLFLMAALAVVSGIWGVATYRHLAALRSDLLSASDQLDLAVAAAADGDLVRAGDLLEASHEILTTVPARVGSVLVAPARLVPGVSRTLQAVNDLARAAEMIADAGIEVARVLGSDAERLGSLAPMGGRIPIETFVELAPVLAEADEAIQQAQSLVIDVPRAGIDTEVLNARDAFLQLVEPAAAQVGNANRVAAILPGLLGAEEAKRYMVVASNPTEARGSGGFWGAFTILTAEDGEMSFSSVRATQDLPELPRGEIPWPDPSLEERYDAYGGTGFIVNLNMTPDFPSAATALENYYVAATGDPLHGVIAVDPFAFEALLRIAGPVQVPGYGTVGADEVVEFVSHDAYAEITDPDERKRLIGLVATIALQGFLDSPENVSASDVLSTVGDMVSRESLLVHAAEPDVQEVLDELGLSGRLGAGAEGDFVGVFLNSGAPYKVDYWLERYLRYDVMLGPGGVAAGTLSTGFTNGAPLTGEPSYMIGFGRGDPLELGDVLSFVSVYCAPGCRLHEVPDSGFDDLVTEQGRELGFGVTSTWMRLPAGQSRELVWSYSTPGAWETRGLDRVYHLHYGHQATIIPTRLDLRVAVPEGYRPTEVPEGADVVEGTVVLQVATSTDLDYEIVFSRIG